MLVGGEWYDATSLTYIANNTNSATVFGAQSVAGGIGLSGASDTNYGVHASSSGNDGLHAVSVNGNAVYGEGTTGVRGVSNLIAVLGDSPGGYALYGLSGTGTAVYAQSDDGDALKTFGRINILDRSGMATIAVGTRTRTVTASFDILGRSQVMCTLDSDQADLFLQRVQKDATANTFKIVLSANVATGKYAKVAWVVFR